MSPAFRIDGTSNEPMDRLTRICAAMTEVFDEHEEHHDDDKCIVFLDDGDKGGIELHGYSDPMDAFVDLVLHIKAMLATIGKNMDIVLVNDEGEVDL